MDQQNLHLTDVEDMERLTKLLTDSSASPVSCSDEELREADFSRRDVLVGTVRSDEQFSYCLENRLYYAPVRTVEAEALPVAVIALYEEGLTRRAGIKRYGEVVETRVVKRSELPVPMSRSNPEEAYYLFSVAEWLLLDRPIALAGTGRGRPFFTSRFLLTHASRSYQLTAIRTPAEYRLCGLLCDLHAQRSEGGEGLPVFRRVGERHILTLSEGRLSLLDENGNRLYTCPAGMLDSGPAEVLRRVAEGLGL